MSFPLEIVRKGEIVVEKDECTLENVLELARDVSLWALFSLGYAPHKSVNVGLHRVKTLGRLYRGKS